MSEYLSSFPVEMPTGAARAEIAALRAELQSLIDVARQPVGTGGAVAPLPIGDLVAQAEDVRARLEQVLSGVGETAAQAVRVGFERMLAQIPALGAEAGKLLLPEGLVTPGGRGGGLILPEAPGGAERIGGLYLPQNVQERAQANLEPAGLLGQGNLTAESLTRLNEAIDRDLKAFSSQDAAATAAAQGRLAASLGISADEAQQYAKELAEARTAAQQGAEATRQATAAAKVGGVTIKPAEDLVAIERANREQVLHAAEDLAGLTRTEVTNQMSINEIDAKIIEARQARATASKEIAAARAPVAEEEAAPAATAAAGAEVAGLTGQQADKLAKINASLDDQIAIVKAQLEEDSQTVTKKAELANLTSELNAKVKEARGIGGPGGPGGPGGGGPGAGEDGGGFFNRLFGGMGLGGNLAQMALFNAQFTAFFALQRGITEAISSAVQLDQQFAVLQARAEAIGQGNQFPALRDNIISTAESTGVAASGVATLSAEFLGLYGNVEQANQATTAAAQLIRVTGINAAQLAQELAPVVNDFGVSVTDVGNSIIDMANKTGRGTTDMAAALGVVSPVAKAVGVSLDEMRGIIEAVTVATGRTGQAAGDLIARLLPQIQSKLPALAEIGFRFTPGAQADAATALREILQQYSQMSQQVQAEVPALVGGPRQAQVFAALAANIPRSMELLNAPLSSNTLLADANQKAQERLGASFDRLRQSLTSVGEAFIHSGILQGVIDLVNAFNMILQVVSPIFNFLDRLNNDLGGLPLRIAAVTAVILLLTKAFGALTAQSALLGAGGLIRGTIGGALFGGGAAATGGAVTGAAAETGVQDIGAAMASGLGPAVGITGAIAGALPTFGLSAALIGGMVIKDQLSGLAGDLNKYRDENLKKYTDSLNNQITGAVQDYTDEVNRKRAEQPPAPGTPALPDPKRPAGPGYWEQVGIQVLQGFGGHEESRQATYDHMKVLSDQNNQDTLAFAAAIQVAQKEKKLSRDKMNSALGKGADDRFNAQTTVDDESKKAMQGQQEGIDLLNKYMPKLLSDPTIGPILQAAEDQVNQQRAKQQKADEPQKAADQMKQIGQGLSDSTGLQLTNVSDVVSAFQAGDVTFNQAKDLITQMTDSLRGAKFGDPVTMKALADAQKFMSKAIVDGVQQNIKYSQELFAAGPDVEVQQLTAALTGPQAEGLRPDDMQKLADQLVTAEKNTFEVGIKTATSLKDLQDAYSKGPTISIAAIDAMNQASIAATGQPVAQYADIYNRELKAFYAFNTAHDEWAAHVKDQQTAFNDEMLGYTEARQYGGVYAAFEGGPGSFPAPTLDQPPPEPSYKDFLAQQGVPQAMQALQDESANQALIQQGKTLSDQQVSTAKLQGATAYEMDYIRLAGLNTVLGKLKETQSKEQVGSDAYRQTTSDINATQASINDTLYQAAQDQLSTIDSLVAFWEAQDWQDPIKQAADELRGAQMGATQLGESIGTILNKIDLGTASADEIKVGMEYLKGSQNQTKAGNDLANAQATYWTDVAKAGGDSVAAARDDIARIQLAMSQVPYGGAAWLALADQQVSANKALTDLNNSITDSYYGYLEAVAKAAGDPVTAAQINITQIRTKIQQLQATGATVFNNPELFKLFGELATAQSGAVDTYISDAETKIKNSIDLNRIGIGQGIQQLQVAEYWAMLAGANQQQLDAIQLQINQLIKQAEGQMNWNLGQISVPTLYAARRLEALSGQNYQDNRTANITIHVNNAADNPGAVGALLAAVGGPARTGTALPSVGL